MQSREIKLLKKYQSKYRVKCSKKYRGTEKGTNFKKYRGTGTQKVPRYNCTQYCPPMYISSLPGAILCSSHGTFRLVVVMYLLLQIKMAWNWLHPTVVYRTDYVFVNTHG